MSYRLFSAATLTPSQAGGRREGGPAGQLPNQPVSSSGHVGRRLLAGLFSVLFGVATSIASLPIPMALAQDTSGQTVDPPARVGRLARIDGTVSFHTADQNTWSAATPNYPITSGNAVWADNGSHAIIDLGGNAINLDSGTELDINQLDDQTFQANVPQGSVYLNLKYFNNGDGYQIATPRGTMTINQPGRYQIITGDPSHPSEMIVYSGGAQVTGDNISMNVGPGQMAVLTDDGQNGPVQATLAGAQPEDRFVVWARNQEPRAAPPAPAVAMTGAQDLGNYGQWATSPDYGDVWYPQVADDWAPYRQGHWAFVAPWGWTWIDDAPWGFAPFHYGRWVQIGPRWAWAPQPIATVDVVAPVVPVYAPALVSFFGDVAGIGVSVGIGIGAAVGWIPLGPREAYYPDYHCSPRYARNVNINYVKNVNIVNINNTTVINNRTVNINNFSNRGGMTVVSRDAMINSRPVNREIQHVNTQQLSQMRTFGAGSSPLRPTAQTVGLTPREAQHYGIAPNTLHRQAAAGPQIREGAQKPAWTQNNRGNNNVQPNARVQTNNGQPAANQVQGNNNRWQNNNNSHQPGAPVRQPSVNNNGVNNNGQGFSNNKPRQENKVTGNQVNGTQKPAVQGQNNGQNSRWNNFNQSHQPGAPVQQRQTNQPQNNQFQNNKALQQENGQARTNTQPQNQKVHQQQQFQQERSQQQTQQQQKLQQERSQQQMQQQQKLQQDRSQQQMQQQQKLQQERSQQQMQQQQKLQQERSQQQMQQQQKLQQERSQQQMQQQERAQQQMQQQQRYQQQMQQQERAQQQMQQQQRYQQQVQQQRAQQQHVEQQRQSQGQSQVQKKPGQQLPQ